jgi:hypothetical protein
MLKIDIRDF